MTRMTARLGSMRRWAAILAVASATGTSGATTPLAGRVLGPGAETGAAPLQSPAAATGRYQLLAWNDLGMHCMDGKDYSVFSILPPFNNLHAQLVERATGRTVTAGVTLRYRSYADAAGSINTSSADKTNFWSFAQPLFGVSLPDDMGLAGFPMASRTPVAMNLNVAQQWFEAAGIPITPVDDAGTHNFYPMVEVTARDTATGTKLATAHVVLPVSDELTCQACHASRKGGNAAQRAARPSGGWAFDPDPERDFKINILKLHDERNLGSASYADALTATGARSDGLLPTVVTDGRPILCAACHGSNALPGTGYGDISKLTAAVHGGHASVRDPVTLARLNASTNRDTCYLCHPGSTTQCLRGAMGAARDLQGDMLMQCQSCHGRMARVGGASRTGWLDEPNCQACHYSGHRETSVFTATGRIRVPTDKRWATDPNVPAAGFSLYRFSTGHGNLQCEACHGATHAEYPSTEPNDNVLALEAQGHAGTIRECIACHATPPYTADGGPHGLHSTTQTWVDRHGSLVESNGASSCGACHGSDFHGAPQSEVRTSRQFHAEGLVKNYVAGDAVSCYDCHNGPGGD